MRLRIWITLLEIDMEPQAGTHEDLCLRVWGYIHGFHVFALEERKPLGSDLGVFDLEEAGLTIFKDSKSLGYRVRENEAW